ncbi:MAG: tRNA uridine(34) 5-carboxymethylaminomethyl modification radical SAM/GNAT enzyme Elp3 [Methanobacteriota archaeon]|nr:MAG: tRNA uridine(34) 5-carboxymethylaminomethyl modification radical SAM/GNAT enzyme Elp3 [Euryarchaeota archaeon]
MLQSGELSTREQVLRAKSALCRKYNMSRVPANYELLKHVADDLREFAEPLLRNKPVRTISGVAPVAVMTSPFDCPHGRCAYCPGGTANGSPQSYTGREPAALRASVHSFDPFRQTRARLEQLAAIGHRTAKVDLIIMGGTFTARPYEYQEWYVKRCFDAMNGCESPDLESSQILNEMTSSRCVGMTIETRPDWFLDEHVTRSTRLGATKVELGVQILDDDILEGVNRGHGVEDTAAATARARQAGLKVCYHIMPGLPGSSAVDDLRSFDLMLEDERFRPDMLKIYPTLVIKGTEVYERWKAGSYSPLELDDALSIVVEMKKRVPNWVRILRVQRDIPVQLIAAGVKKSHLRELATEQLRLNGLRCECIRCREVGHMGIRGRNLEPEEANLEVTSYRGSGGMEHFLSCKAADSGALVGYARLRSADDSKSHPARVRELHVYGELTPFDSDTPNGWQHRGIGELLLSRCEELSAEFDHDTISVTSGVGAREYYRRLGYERNGMYMEKMLCR